MPNFEAYVPIRQLTHGPKHHWFGYYDKEQLDPAGRYVLAMEVDFEHRTPRVEDTIGIGLIDTQNGDCWRELGATSAWGWQQGCMLQWLPGSAGQVIWNDREGDRFISQILDIETGERRRLPHPIYALSPDGRYAVGTDFRRIQAMRPGYGYAVSDAGTPQKIPEDVALYRLDLTTGERRDLTTLAEVAAIPFQGRDISNAYHWFNHLLVGPDSERIIFLHRWYSADEAQPPRFHTRMFTVAKDGSDLYCVDDGDYMSHFIWRDSEHICAWAKPSGQDREAFYLFKDKTAQVEAVGHGVMIHNGHNTYLPNTNNEWILNDTYPLEDRFQELYLYHVPTQRRVELGRFYAPPAYTGEWRCDLHPRSSRDGRIVIIDSAHGGSGRQLYALEVGGIVGQV